MKHRSNEMRNMGIIGILVALSSFGLLACDDAISSNTPCGDTVCDAGQSCVDGTCIPKERVCGDKICGEKQICLKNVCYDIEEENPGQPVVDLCADVKCDAGEKCFDGICMSEDPCAKIICAEGTCVKGNCVKEDPCAGVQCSDGQSCLLGYCVDDACIENGALLTCEAGKVCSKGECVDDGCADVNCNSEEICVRGICEETACIGIFCESGQSCKGGNCVENACLAVECSSEEVCSGGICIPASCKEVKCSQGKVCVADGSCQFESAPALLVEIANQDAQTDEDGKTAVIHVSLNYQPASDVTVSCAVSETKEAKIDGETLVFTAENWNIVQNVTVTGLADYAKDGDQNYEVRFSSASEDTDFDGLSGKAELVNLDKTGNGLVFELPEMLMTSEDLTSIDIGVSLASQPTSDVRVSVASSDPGEGTVSVSELLFTAENWNQPQIIQVTGVNDDDQDGSQEYSIIFGALVSEDPAFNGLETPAIAIMNQDNDKAGVTVPLKKLTTNEKGKSISLPVVLNTKPSSDVVISISSSNEKEATVDVKTMTFTPENWNVKQMVIVTGEPDSVIDGNQEFVITFDISSEDGAYDELGAITIKGVNEDTDEASLMIVSDGTRDLLESGTEASFNVTLSSKPTDDVVLKVFPEDTSEVRVVNGTELTFTPENWNVEQTVTVAGVDDLYVDGNIKTLIRIEASSKDKEYAKLSMGAITYTTIDDDVAGFVVTGEDKALREEAGETASYTVRLSSQPTTTVKLNLASADASELILDDTNATLTFTTSNWNVAQTVKVKSVDDSWSDGNQDVVINMTASSSDGNYNKLKAVSPVYTIIDNESASLVVTPNSLSVANGNDVSDIPENTLYISVKLGSQPSSDVIVTVESEEPNTAWVNGSLTFTSANWNVEQKLTVSGTCTAALSQFNLIVKSASTGSSSYNDPKIAKNVSMKLTCGESVQKFGYSSCAVQTRTLYPGKYRLQVWGAQGGDGVGGSQTKGSHGGLGGYSEGIIDIKEKTTAYVWIGAQGQLSSDTEPSGGGCNGGGHGKTTSPWNGYGAGGGTDIRLGADSLYARVIVAGGGGGTDNPGGTLGGGDDGSGGVGGGLVGGDGYVDGKIGNPKGATQTTGYQFGVGQPAPTGDRGGGGGGWFGGYYSATANGGGSGGSGFIYMGSPDLSEQTIGGKWLLKDSQKLSSGATYDGNQTFEAPGGGTEKGHGGNGYAIISFVEN